MVNKTPKKPKLALPKPDIVRGAYHTFPPNAKYPAFLRTPIYVPMFANKAMTPARVQAALEISKDEIDRKLRALAEHYGVTESDEDAAIKLFVALANAHVPGMKLSFRRPPKKTKGPEKTEKRRSDAQWHYVQIAKDENGLRYDADAIRFLMTNDHPLFRRQTENVIAQRVKEAKGRYRKQIAEQQLEKEAFDRRISGLMADAKRRPSRKNRTSSSGTK